jgi:hypothetical protein
MKSSNLSGVEILNRFAATISQHRPGLVKHAPEPWAKPMQCFNNIAEKVQREGGHGLCGWVFLERMSLEFGPYLIAVHHALWIAEAGRVPVDITPFHGDPMHQPYGEDGHVLFLLDDASKPKVIGGAIAPLPSRFYPATDDPKLAAYMDELTRQEQIMCEKIYAGAVAAHLSSQRPN